MHWIRNIAREVFGLFVDDGSFAIAVLAWIAVVWFVLVRIKAPMPGGIILFLGLGFILVESVSRFSRRTPKYPPKLQSD